MSAFFVVVDWNGQSVGPEAEAVARAMACRGVPAGPVVEARGVVAGVLAPPGRLGADARVQAVADDGLVLAGDIRLDDRRALVRSAFGSERPPTDLGDGRLVLAGYRKLGRAVLQHLDGDFAFALWDARERVLLAARDAFGMRRLHYRIVPGGLVVTTTAWGAAAAGPAPTLDEARIADYLVADMEGADFTRTFFREVHRLPPASLLVARAGGVAVERRSILDPDRELHLGDDRAYDAALREHLERATRQRMPAEARAGVLLSGGLDSSAVAFELARLEAQRGGGRPPVFSAYSADRRGVEDQHLQVGVATGAFEHHDVGVDAVASAMPDLWRLLAEADDPFVCWMPMIQLLYRAAAEAGVGVVMDGLDGDTVFTLGSSAGVHLLRAGRLREAIAQASAGAAGPGLTTARAWTTLAINLAVALTPRPLRAVRRRHRRFPSRLLAESIIDVAFAARTDVAGRWLDQQRLDWPVVPRTYREAHAQVLNAPWQAVGLERYDQIAAFHGIEARRPMWDLELVRFALALPVEQATRDGWSKFILRRATAGLVPDAIRWRRPRVHVGHQYIRRGFELASERIDEVVHGGGWRTIEAYVDGPKLQAAHRRWRDTGDEASMHKVWQAVTLRFWLDHARRRLASGRRPTTT